MDRQMAGWTDCWMDGKIILHTHTFTIQAIHVARLVKFHPVV